MTAPANTQPSGASGSRAVPAPARPSQGDRPWRGAVGWAVPGAVAGAVVLVVVHRGLIDDAYITLAYARQLATHLHWGLIPTETANTATSPLNVLLLGASTWLVRLVTGDVRPVVGLGVLSVVLSAALGGWSAQVAHRLRVSPAWSLAVLAVVFANPFVNSAIGLEVLPTAALLAGLLAQAAGGHRVAFGIVAGLVVLTRLDLAVVVLAVWLLTPAVRRRGWVPLAIAALVAAPWFLFSWWQLGSAVPTSFVIKTLQHSFGSQTFANGLWTLWAPRGTLPFLLAAVPAAVGLVTAVVVVVLGLARRLPPGRSPALQPVAGLGLGGAAYFAAYCALGVPPYQWYYVPTTAALGIAGVFGLALALRRGPLRRPSAGAVAAVAATAVLAVLGWLSLDGRPVPWAHPGYFGNWAEPAQYRAVGAAVGARIGDDTVQAPPEIGTLAFSCQCSIVDVFSDPGRTLPLVQQRIDAAGPVTRALLRLDFARLDRSDRPRPAQWQLVWTQGPVPAGVESWPVSSPATGRATLYLQRLSEAGR